MKLEDFLNPVKARMLEHFIGFDAEKLCIIHPGCNGKQCPHVSIFSEPVTVVFNLVHSALLYSEYSHLQTWTERGFFNIFF